LLTREVRFDISLLALVVAVIFSIAPLTPVSDWLCFRKEHAADFPQGQIIDVRLPNGQVLLVRVPAGAEAGSRMAIKVPASRHQSAAAHAQQRAVKQEAVNAHLRESVRVAARLFLAKLSLGMFPSKYCFIFKPAFPSGKAIAPPNLHARTPTETRMVKLPLGAIPGSRIKFTLHGFTVGGWGG
jgi:hypothetical protein